MPSQNDYLLVQAIVASKIFDSKDIVNHTKSFNYGKLNIEQFINKVGFSKEKVVDSMRQYVDEHIAIKLKSQMAWDAAKQYVSKFKSLKRKNSYEYRILYFRNNEALAELTYNASSNQISYSRTCDRDYQPVKIGKDKYLIGRNSWDDNIVTILCDVLEINAMMDMSDEYESFLAKWGPLKSNCMALLQLPNCNYDYTSAAVDVYFNWKDKRVYVLTGYADGLSVISDNSSCDIIKTTEICHEI